MPSLDHDNIYRYHAPHDDQPRRYEKIRRAARLFAELIDVNCPDSRERSLAFTNLKQCVMWASAAIARNE
jgi:hypothetical protein